MLIAVTLLLVSQVIAGIAVTFYAKRRIGVLYKSVSEYYRAFTYKKDSETPSALEQTIDNIALMFSARLYTTIQSRSMATKSQISRQANLIAEDMISDQAGQANPFLGMFLDQFPTVKQRLAKNPMAFQAILPMINDLVAGGAAKSEAQQKPADANNNGNGKVSYDI